jgi:hypothetical protein
MKIKVNEGKSDRIVRVIIAALLFVFALVFAQGTARIFFLILAAMMSITTFMGWCPLYILFGFSTCDKESIEKESATDSAQDEE